MEFWPIVILATTTVILYMTGFFIKATDWKDMSIVDIAWGLGFIVIAFVSFAVSLEMGVRQALVTIFVTIWGTRLSIHIANRKQGKGEDFRYAQWRKEWGQYVVVRSFFQVFMLQGAIMLVIALPIMLVFAYGGGPLTFLNYIGISIWLVGFFFEAVGDYQLNQFIKNPDNKGKLMTEGLWKYTRHPNYFGEATMWWGIAIMCLGIPSGYYGLLSPILLTFLLLYVSGVPMLEKKFSQHPDWNKYASRTNAFIPWIPKKSG